MTGTCLSVAVTGASGLIGAALCTVLVQSGHRVLRLVRRPAASPDEVSWSTAGGVRAPQQLSGVDALVHLAGENLAAGRWTQQRMEEIRGSRVAGTTALLASLAKLDRPPATLLCASAVGFYGDRGDEVLDETRPPGRGFVPDLCQAWERAACDHAPRGTRLALLRFGVVLSAAGGMLRRLLTPFRLGLGGPVGSGRQYMSWVSLPDALGAVCHVLTSRNLSGPVNIVAPEPVTNAEFVRQLGRALHRPAVCRIPATLLRLVVGRLADELLLASTRAVPSVLLRSGYLFRHPRLDVALHALLHPDAQ